MELVVKVLELQVAVMGCVLTVKQARQLIDHFPRKGERQRSESRSVDFTKLRVF